jgi:hypothetical protein
MIHGHRTDCPPDIDRQLCGAAAAVLAGCVLGIAGMLALILGVMA